MEYIKDTFGIFYILLYFFTIIAIQPMAGLGLVLLIRFFFVKPLSTNLNKHVKLLQAGAFMFGFGWGGLGAFEIFESKLQGGWPEPMNVILYVFIPALICGTAVWIFIYLSKISYTSFNNNSTKKKEPISILPNTIGIVSVAIPKKLQGTGQITIDIQGKQHNVDVVTNGDETIPYGSKVKIIFEVNEGVFLVKRHE